MKKIVLILAAFVVLSALSSCSEKADNPIETENETQLEATVGEDSERPSPDDDDKPKRLTNKEKAEFSKVVEFDFPEGNFRDVLVDTMRKYASIEWVAGEDFGMKQDNGDWSVELSYKKGTKYYGLPYTSYNINYDYFADLIVDGKYAPADPDWNKAAGVNCFSSIFISYQQFEAEEGGIYAWLPGQEKFDLETVGGYKIPSNPQTTTEILTLNGKDAMYDAYTQLKKGDIIYVLKNQSTGNLHCRVVVEEPNLVKNGAGKLIPTRSTIKTIEQTNKFDQSRKDGVNTTWYVDHEYAFDKLFDSGYIPLTLPSYSKDIDELEVPYLGIDAEITSSALAKGIVNSMVKSNYPLRFVRVEILDKSGNVVLTKEMGDMHNAFKNSLRNNFMSVFDKLENGNYTFVLTAGISAGNAELARVDFAYNK